MNTLKAMSVLALIFFSCSCSIVQLPIAGEVLAQEIESDQITLAVWGFLHWDRDSRSMARDLPGDFTEVAKEYDNLNVLPEKEIEEALEEISLEELDQDIAAELALKIGADISIWGDVTQTGSTSYNVTFFILDSATQEINYLSLTVERAKDKRLSAVRQVIEKAIEMKGSASQKTMEIALNLFNSGQYEEAKNAFQEVIRLDPTEIDAYTHLAYIYGLEADYDSAIQYYQKALEIDPNNVVALEGLAWAYQVIGENDEAGDIYRQLTEINPENPEYWVCVGEICRIEDDFEDAIAAYQKVLEINPEDIDAHRAVGLLYFEERMYNEAIPHLKAVVDAGVEDSEVSKNLAIAYQQTGRIEESIQQNLDLIAKDSTQTTPYLNLAAIYTEQQRFEEAIDALEKYIELRPNIPTGHNRIADVYRQMRNYEKGIEHAQRSLEIDPNQPEPYIVLGEIDYARGYENYQQFVEYDNRAKDPELSSEYEENNRLRKLYKQRANDFFVSAKQYYQKADSLTEEFFMQQRIQERLDVIDQLIEETKFDPFYDS